MKLVDADGQEYRVYSVSTNSDSGFADGYRIQTSWREGHPKVFTIYPFENNTAPWLPDWANDVCREMGA